MAKQRRTEWLERIRGVEREFLTARQAVDDFVDALKLGTAELPPNTKERDVNAMSEHLEGTYLIRLYAAFESGLRSYWETLGRDTVPPSKDLIDSIAARRVIPDDVREEVHEVREYRNGLVHENDAEATAVEIGESRSRLCTYFARLPNDW